MQHELRSKGSQILRRMFAGIPAGMRIISAGLYLGPPGIFLGGLIRARVVSRASNLICVHVTTHTGPGKHARNLDP